MPTHKIRFSVQLIAALCMLVVDGLAQVPGDGIPDVYYSSNDRFVPTSLGIVPIAGETLLVDTDGTDMVAIFVGGSDLSIDGCELCDGMNLPGADELANASAWTVGYSAGSTQWIRTNPLVGLGFRGVIGVGYIDGNDMIVNSWPQPPPPFLNFSDPGRGLASVSNFCRESVFEDDLGETWEVEFVTDGSDVFYTNISPINLGGPPILPPHCVPEPNGGWHIWLLPGCLWFYATCVTEQRRKSIKSGPSKPR
jgi:hypothetical protein